MGIEPTDLRLRESPLVLKTRPFTRHGRLAIREYSISFAGRSGGICRGAQRSEGKLNFSVQLRQRRGAAQEILAKENKLESILEHRETERGQAGAHGRIARKRFASGQQTWNRSTQGKLLNRVLDSHLKFVGREHQWRMENIRIELLCAFKIRLRIRMPSTFGQQTKVVLTPAVFIVFSSECLEAFLSGLEVAGFKVEQGQLKTRLWNVVCHLRKFAPRHLKLSQLQSGQTLKQNRFAPQVVLRRQLRSHPRDELKSFASSFIRISGLSNEQVGPFKLQQGLQRVGVGQASVQRLGISKISHRCMALRLEMSHVVVHVDGREFVNLGQRRFEFLFDKQLLNSRKCGVHFEELTSKSRPPLYCSHRTQRPQTWPRFRALLSN
jgi:hypothetical protein